MIEITHPHAQRPPDPSFIDVSQLVPAPKDGPKGSDLHPLRAEFAVPAFCCELHPDRAIECIVGESIRIVQVHGIPGAHWSITRAPAGSSAKLDGSRLVADVPGLFALACTLPGNWRREILIAAVPEAALDLVTYPPRMQLERRMRLRAILHDGNATADSIIAGLERGETDLAALAGYGGKKRGGFSVERYK
jgi:hypothetical protein